MKKNHVYGCIGVFRNQGSFGCLLFPFFFSFFSSFIRNIKTKRKKIRLNLVAIKRFARARSCLTIIAETMTMYRSRRTTAQKKKKLRAHWRKIIIWKVVCAKIKIARVVYTVHGHMLHTLSLFSFWICARSTNWWPCAARWIHTYREHAISTLALCIPY